jgi:hypothetical protein
MSVVPVKKLAELQKLKAEIKNQFEKQNERVWFYEDFYEGKDKKIKGFLGTSDIIVIGERPATPKSPDMYIKLFYETLKECGLESTHLTDFIKTVGKAGKWTIEDMKESLPFLKKELEILSGKTKPLRIICLGDRVYNWVCPCIISLGVRASIQKSKHYAYRFKKKEEREIKFKEDFRRAFARVRVFRN